VTTKTLWGEKRSPFSSKKDIQGNREGEKEKNPINTVECRTVGTRAGRKGGLVSLTGKRRVRQKREKEVFPSGVDGLKK